MNTKTKILLSIIIFTFLLVAIFYDPSFLVNTVFAQWTEQASEAARTAQQSNTDFVWLLESFVKFLYIITRPFLTIAWFSMSNEFVYGSVFFIDDSIWTFWNMMKNFANYIIGFLFLMAVFLYFFNYKQDTFNPKALLPKMLIATIGVQASWFILAALIDISTILTYALWWMPLTILEKIETDWEPVMMPIMRIDWTEWLQWLSEDRTALFFTAIWTDTAYATCEIDWSKIDADSLNARAWTLQESLQTFWTNYPLDLDNCVIWNRLFRNQNTDNFYDRALIVKAEEVWAITIKEFSDNLKWFTGPMYTLFWSLLNVSDMSISAMWWNSNSIWSYTVLALMKTLMMFALIIPLLTLAVVLIVRWVILWMIIALSPLLTISWTFWFNIWSSEKLSLWSVLWVIFLPVVAAFAISISIIFLTLLNNTLWTWAESKTWIYKSLNMEAPIPEENWDVKNICVKLPVWEEANRPKMCFWVPNQDLWISPFLDVFSWFIINLFWIAVMWSIIFAALKTSKLTWWIVNWVDNISREAFKTAPILPTPWWAQSIGSLQKSAAHLAEQPSRIQWDQFRKGWLLDTIESFQWKLSWDNTERLNSFNNKVSWEWSSNFDWRWFTSAATNAVWNWRNIESVSSNVLSQIKSRPEFANKNIESLMDIATNPELRSLFNNNYWNIDELVTYTRRQDDAQRWWRQSIRRNQISIWLREKLMWSNSLIWKIWDTEYFKDNWFVYAFMWNWEDLSLVSETNLSNVDQVTTLLRSIWAADVENIVYNINKVLNWTNWYTRNWNDIQLIIWDKTYKVIHSDNTAWVTLEAID